MNDDLTDLDAPAALAAAVASRRAADFAEADLLVLAAHWADLHAVAPGAAPAGDRVGPPVFLDGAEQLVPLAGEGTPQVAEFAPGELGAALSISTHAARLVGDALELRHRLPRLWARVQAGQLPAWRARQVAEHTKTLSRQAAGFVDAQVAPYAHKIGLQRVLTLVDVAIRRPDHPHPDHDDPDAPDTDDHPDTSEGPGGGRAGVPAARLTVRRVLRVLPTLTPVLPAAGPPVGPRHRPAAR